jgi:hypothetical protein
MATVKLKVDLKDSAYLAANPTKVLTDNEVIFLDDGRYAFGDGSTTLSALTFFGGGTEQATGLVDGGTITVGSYGGSGSDNDIRVAAAEWYISSFGTFVTTTNTDFLDIALSSSGTQRYVGLFGKNDGTIIKSEGSEAALASLPATPADHAVIGYVLVTSTAVSSTPDLSGYLLRADKATAADVAAATNDEKYITPLAIGQASPYDISSARFTGKRFTVPHTGNWSNTSGSLQSALWAMPCPVGPSLTITQLIFTVAGGAGVGRTARIGLASADSSGYPSTIVEDSGELSCASTGEKTFILSTPRTMTGRIFYFLIQTSDANVLVNISGNAIRLLNLEGAVNGGASYFATRAYAAFPASYPAGASKSANAILVEAVKQ